MGYQITFTPTEEAMAKYKPRQEKRPDSNDSLVDIVKYEIISYCMNNKEETPSKIIKQIGFLLRWLKNAIEEEEKSFAYFRWKDDEKHELWYCGWEYSRESRFNIDDTIRNYTEKLFIFANLVKTPDYFSEHENFFTKYNDLVEDIDGFCELIRDIVIHNIIDELDEFKVKSDDTNE